MIIHGDWDSLYKFIDAKNVDKVYWEKIVG